MAIDKRIIEAAEIAAGRLSLPAHFLAAWFISENGRSWPETNNVGNISYSGEGIPSGGVFEGVTAVEDNRVCVYDSIESGVNAFVHLLETPKADKVLTLDLSDLTACGGDISAMCIKVGESNWAESHYDSGGGPGSLIYGVYGSDDVKAAFTIADVAPTPTKAPAAVRPDSHLYTVQPGDTLSKIALGKRVTVKSLQVYNNIEDPDKIEAGQTLVIPYTYQVKSGDTVSQIAAYYGTSVQMIAWANSINPDFIRTGEVLFV